MNYLGIDISKRYFDITLRNESGEENHARFDNKQTGFKALDKWLGTPKVKELHACMEATNIYWEDLADHLYEQGYQVSVVNPARIKGFGMSQMQRNKTDKVDSKVIVAFCAAIVPKLWTPPTQEQRKLRALVRHRATLIKTRTQQTNRLTDCRDEAIQRSLQCLIDAINSEMEWVEKQITALIKQSPTLSEEKKLLTSIDAIGDTVAHTIMAEMYDLADYENAHAAAADVGVNPSHHESGDTIRKKPKMSKMGKSAVRGVIFMPAMVAIRHNPSVRALAQRLEARGKPKMVIVGAAMRKLIHIAYGVLKHRTPFDPNFELTDSPNFQPAIST